MCNFFVTRRSISKRIDVYIDVWIILASFLIVKYDVSHFIFFVTRVSISGQTVGFYNIYFGLISTGRNSIGL